VRRRSPNIIALQLSPINTVADGLPGQSITPDHVCNVPHQRAIEQNRIIFYATRTPDNWHATIDATLYYGPPDSLAHCRPPNPWRRTGHPPPHTTRSEEICVGALMPSNSTACTSGTSHLISRIETDDTAVVFDGATWNTTHGRIGI
jgi:hypothetical protein